MHMFTKKEKDVVTDNITKVIAEFDRCHKQKSCSLIRGYQNLQHIVVKSIRTRKRQGYLISIPTRYELLACQSNRYHYELYYPCLVPYITKTQFYRTLDLKLIREIKDC